MSDDGIECYKCRDKAAAAALVRGICMAASQVCGVPAVHDRDHRPADCGCVDTYHRVACSGCRYRTAWARSWDDTRRRWNTRPVEDRLRAEVARLREALARIPVDEIADRIRARSFDGKESARVGYLRTTLYEARDVLEEKKG